MNVSLQEIARLVDGVVVGDERVLVCGLAPIDDVSPGSLVFADGAQNLERAEASAAGAILAGEQVVASSKPLVRVKHPFAAFIQLMEHFFPEPAPAPGVHPSAFVAPDVTLGARVSIGPFVSIGAGSVIGDDCVLLSHVSVGSEVTLGAGTRLYPHVTVYDKTRIGARVRVHAGSVIGSDGFGYTFINGQHQKVPHIGSVVIGDDVEIGANTVIDRATMGATQIGEGTKIDNLVQVAHSVRLGRHNILCAFTGVAGSTVSGDRVVFAANVGVSDHVRIDDDVVLGARAGVPPKKHLKQGNVYLGSPARPRDKAIEQELSVTRIPIMRKNLRALSERVDALHARVERDGETSQ